MTGFDVNKGQFRSGTHPSGWDGWFAKTVSFEDDILAVPISDYSLVKTLNLAQRARSKSLTLFPQAP